MTMPLSTGQNAQSTLFDLARSAMSAQLVRMNAAASNLANAGTVAGSEAGAYRPIRAIFAEVLDKATGLAGVRVAGIMREQSPAIKEHNPDHPLADANGDVWASPVDENAENVEMLESSRQYQNMVEALSTAKQLMLDTIRMK
jgi:flagellar basal-body rod protein FlgC